ncbi:hypothetical protein [Streptomyces lincolnensis]|uniref:hypothetical protein n=1 Tax=Streptomyces lincolnensis TaxID=1915 RepID=UPI0037D18A46
MTSALFLALTLAPFITPCVVVITAAVLARRLYRRPPGSLRRPPSVATCGLIAVMSGAAAFGAYAWGVMSGFYILDPDQLCQSLGARGDHIVTRETLPVSAQCVTSDGVGTELVPDWVNPMIFIGLTLFALAVTTAAVTGTRRVLTSR